MDNTFFQLITYFVVYSFLGWVFESTVRTICEKKLINTGFLIGPFCPIYGFGAITMIVFFNELKDSKILLFLVSFIVLTLWEYVVGVFLEKIFKTKYWDYSDHKFNFKGRICLMNSIAWGVIGLLFIEYIHPFILKIIGYCQSEYITLISIIIFIIILIDAITNAIKIKNIKSTLEKVEEINEQIKQKLLEIKDKTPSGENVVKGLKTRRDRMLRKLYRRAYRLKRAFPAIDTKEFTEILSKKVEKRHKKTKKKGE